MSARAALPTALLLGGALVLPLAVQGCGDARPRTRYINGPTTAPGATASATPAAGPTAGGPGASAPAPVASGAAPVSSGVAPVASGAPAGPGGLTAGGLSQPPQGASPAPLTSLTVGAGPVLGHTARGDVYEHLRDWSAADLRALDPRDARLAGDGLRDSRELVACYSRRQAGRLFLRLDLLDLRYGAELGGLDLVVLLSWQGAQGRATLPLGLSGRTAHPWDAALLVRDGRDLELIDPAGAARATGAGGDLEAAFRSDLDAVELSLPEASLRALGWDGRPLGLQVLSLADGQRRPADAILELDLDDGSLDEVVTEGWVAPRRAALALVAVGNRAALPASTLTDLVHSRRLRTSEGFPTGLRRTLESHAAHRLPLNVHLSGVLTSAIGWASAADPSQDGPAFLADVARLWDGDPSNGEGAYLPGLHVDNVMPFAAGLPNTRFIARGAEVARGWLGVTAPGPVFWTPERVISGATFAELRAAGFSHTVLDRSHLRGWFGQTVSDGRLHRINGVDCFVIDPSVSPFALDDGGPALRLRELLLERALDPDPAQAVVLVADWEEFAGHKGDPDVPDRYDRVLAWLSQRPWVEVATLAELAGRGWPSQDHGSDPTLPVETYEWLRHACEERYDHWYYGHPLEESFAAFRPLIRAGRPHARRMGDLATPGTLLGDVWGAVQAAPPGGLRDLAELGLSSALYRTAWHQEDQHDTTLLNSGAYLNPDTTWDRMTGFVRALSSHVGESAITAWAAGWAARPPAAPGVLRRDVDLDGEEEWILCDDRLALVCEADGGRVVAGFARDAAGAGYQVLGAPLSFPESSDESGWEDPTVPAPRNSVLKDVWASGAGRDYVNDAMVATVSTSSVALTFRSSDGRLEKTLTWRAPGEVEVDYRLDPALGTLWVRCGLSPDLAGLVQDGQRGLRELDDGRRLTFSRLDPSGREVWVRLGYADAGHQARRNAQASDGTPASPRNTAFQQLVELSGDAPGFRFSLAAGVR